MSQRPSSHRADLLHLHCLQKNSQNPPPLQGPSRVWVHTGWVLVLLMLALASGFPAQGQAKPSALQDGATLVRHAFPSLMECGSSHTATVTLRNSGTSTWNEETRIRLGGVGGADPFTSQLRVVIPQGVEIAPEGEHTFEIDLTAPTTPGNYLTDWRMVHETVRWFGDTTQAWIDVACQTGEQDDAAVGKYEFPRTMTCGSSTSAMVEMRNTGTSIWRADHEFLLGQRTAEPATQAPLRFILPAGVEILPGQSHHFRFDLNAPNSAGIFDASWQMLHQRVDWFGASVPSSIEVTCNDFGVVFSEPKAETLHSGESMPWGVLHERAGQVPFHFAIMGPDGPQQSISNLRVVSIDGPVALELVTLSPGSSTSSRAGLGISGTLEALPKSLQDARATTFPFQATVAFDHGLGETFQFDIVGHVQKASFNDTDNWSFSWDDYFGQYTETIPAEQLPQTVSFTGRIVNHDFTETLVIDGSGISRSFETAPFDFRSTLEIAFGGSQIEIPPGGDFTFRLHIDAGVFAESGLFSVDVVISPTNSNVIDVRNVSVDFDIQGADVSADAVSVRLLNTGAITGSGGFLDLPEPVAEAIGIDFDIINDNLADIRVENLSASVFGQAGGGLRYNPFPTSGVVSTTFPSLFGGQLEILSNAVPGDFEIRVVFTVTDDAFPPQTSEQFFFTIFGTLTACGGSGNCGPIVEVKDDAGRIVRGTYRKGLPNSGPSELEFKIGNVGDEPLTINPTIGLSGHSRFTVTQAPTETTLPIDSNQTSDFKITFDGEGTDLDEVFATNVTINGNGANSPYTFRLEATTRRPIPLIVEVIGFTVADGQVNLGTSDHLPLLPVIRITNPTGDKYYIKSFRSLKSRGGPLEWSWESPVPESSDSSDAVVIDRNGDIFHGGGKIDLDGSSGDVNKPYTFNFSFEYATSRPGTYSDFDLAINGDLTGIYNPIPPLPEIDCENPDNMCVENYCGALNEILPAGLPGVSCLAAAASLYSCVSCAPTGPVGCWISCLSAAVSTVICPVSVADIVDDLRQAVVDTRACYCDTLGTQCEESFFVGYDILGQPIATELDVTGQCITPTGSIFNETAFGVGRADAYEFELLRCPDDSVYSVSTTEVTGAISSPYKCRLVNPMEGDQPQIPQYNGTLNTHFSAVFDCSCPFPGGCGQLYTLTGTAIGLQPGDAPVAVVNINTDPAISLTVPVTENGNFQFISLAPAAPSYSVSILNKPDYPHCTIEPTGNSISGPASVIDVARLTCDTSRPNVRIIDPADGATVSPSPTTGTITVLASAGDAAGLSNVAFYADGALIGVSNGSSYQVEWVPAGTGPRNLQALATNVNGVTTWSDVVTVTVEGSTACQSDSGPPTIEWVDPAVGSVITRDIANSLALMARAVDDTATNFVDFFFDGLKFTHLHNGPIYSVNIPSVALGQHTLRVRASDVCGKITEIPEYTFTVVESDPTVANGGFLNASCSSLSGWALDVNHPGAIRVELYRGGPRGSGTLLGSVFGDESCAPGGTAQCWSMPTPSSLETGNPETIYAHARDVDTQGQPTGAWQELLLSPKTITCGDGGPGGGPSPPASISASDGTFNDRVRVTWTPVSGATGYEVYRNSTNQSSSASMIAPSVGTTTHDDMAATGGNTYFYWTKAKNAQGTSAFSSADSGYIDNTPTNTAGPEGTLDAADCTKIAGWARDPDYTGRVQVHIYRNGPAGTGTVLATIWADLNRPGLPFPDKDHGFHWNVPAGSIPNGTPIYAYGIGVDSNGNMNGQNPQLVSSPRSFDCPSAPAAPTNVNATDGTYNNKVRVVWSSASGATHYSVWRHTANNVSQAAVLNASVVGNLFDDTNVNPGTTYYYWLKAHNAQGASGFSAPNTGFANNTPTNTTGPEGTLDAADCTKIAGWARDPDYTGRVQVHIYRDGPFGTGTILANVWADLNRPGLPFPDKDHGFHWNVPAGSIPNGTPIYAYGIGVDSNGTVNGQNPQLVSSPRSFDCPSAPAAPTNVNATDGTYNNKVRVAWSSASGATHYSVWRHTANNASQAAVLNASVVGNIFDDTNVNPGTTYYYWLKAHNAQGASGFSAPNTGFANNTPTNTTGPEGTLDAADCTKIAGWARDPDYTGRVQVHIYRNGPAGTGTVLATIWADLNRPGLPFPDKDHGFHWNVPAGSIPHGTMIYAYGIGVDSNGTMNGQNPQLVSSPRSFDCPSAPAAPTNVNATDGTYNNKVRVAWSSASGATHYSVWRHTANNAGQASALSTNVTGSLFDDTNVNQGTTYYYWVKAHNAQGASGFSTVNTGYSQAQAPTNTTGPEGTLDVADCTRIAGWARDPDYTGRVQVHIYRDGPFGTGTILANVWADLNRPELPFPDKDHGFRWNVPAGSIPNGTMIYAYGIGVDSNGNMNGQNPQLVSSPRAMICP